MQKDIVDLGADYGEGVKVTRLSGRWKLLRLDFTSEAVREHGWLDVLWGFDIFLGEIPFMKSLILANIIVWVILFLI